MLIAPATMKMTRFPGNWQALVPRFWRDTFVTVLVLVAASGICTLLLPVSDSGVYVPLIFVLAVLIISLLTEGYFYGIFGSLLAVVGVNYIFTFPYLALNFSISGYPLTFLIMLTVSIIISTLTSRVKQQERMRLEIERETVRANLLRAISHDLRTPLTSIVGSTGVILDNYDRLPVETKRQLLRDVQEDAQWLIRMVENLLSITRIGTDPSQANLYKTPEAVEEILGEVLEKFRKRYPGAAVTVRVPDELLMAPMDAMLIEQVIMNIMENAVIHGGAGEISLIAYQHDMNAVFEILDNGRGIPAELLPRIFSGSYPGSPRGHQEADSRRSMGIGLSVCTSIIKAHGGLLTARNRTDSHGAALVLPCRWMHKKMERIA
jgi:two-component system sensor histidine kinase KdpD